jgi:hypothetical protein
VTLGQTPDGRVAGHLGNGIYIAGQEEGTGAHSGGGKGGFTAGVAGSANDGVKGV